MCQALLFSALEYIDNGEDLAAFNFHVICLGKYPLWIVVILLYRQFSVTMLL